MDVLTFYLTELVLYPEQGALADPLTRGDLRSSCEQANLLGVLGLKPDGEGDLAHALRGEPYRSHSVWHV